MTSLAAEQPLGAGEVGDVGRDLAGEHRIIGQAGDLRRLDLGVPIGALDQPDHQLAAVRAGQRRRPSRTAARRASDRPGCARPNPPQPLANRASSAASASMMSSDSSSRSASSASMVKWTSAGAGLQRQLAQHRQDRRLGLVGVAPFVARMERRQLDRNARRRAEAALGFARRCGRARRHRPRRSARRRHGSRAASPSMSKLWVRPLRRSGAARFSASSMVRPNTNCRPRIFIASLTAVRITGSPSRPTARPSAARQPSRAVVGAVEHLAGQQQREGRGVDEGRARCRRASPPSRARPACRRSVRRRCAASGMRSSASARHISAMPSSLPRS